MDIKELLEKLFEGSELSTEFKEKFSSIFENSFDEKIEEVRSEIEEEYTKKIEEYTKYLTTEMEKNIETYIEEQLTPMVDRYLNFSVDEFVKENASDIENKIKVDLADKFLTGFVGITEAYNVEVPEGQATVIDELKEDLKKMQERFDSSLTANTQLKEEFAEYQKKNIFEKCTKDLTDTQKEKLLKISEKVKFETEEQYTASIKELFEAYCPVISENIKKDEGGIVEEKVTNVDPWLANLFGKI